MDTILVTGAQGFTGRFLVARLLRAQAKCQVIGIGRGPQNDTHFTHSVTLGAQRCRAPLPDELHAADKARYSYYSCSLDDIAGLSEIVLAHRPSVVFHLAAALRDDLPERLIESNVIGTIGLLKSLARVAPRPKLVLASSGSVYGANGSPCCREADGCVPSEPYAMSKLASEYCVEILAPSLELNFVVARIFNIAGPGQDERHVCGRFAAQAVAVLAGLSEPRIEVGDLSPTRDFIDVRDVAEALVLLARAGSAGLVYNVASGTETAIGAILDGVLRFAGVKDRVTVTQRYARRHDLSRQFAEIDLLKALGYQPRYTIDDTLRDVVAYYKVLCNGVKTQTEAV